MKTLVLLVLLSTRADPGSSDSGRRGRMAIEPRTTTRAASTGELSLCRSRARFVRRSLAPYMRFFCRSARSGPVGADGRHKLPSPEPQKDAGRTCTDDLPKCNQVADQHFNQQSKAKKSNRIRIGGPSGLSLFSVLLVLTCLVVVALYVRLLRYVM